MVTMASGRHTAFNKLASQNPSYPWQWQPSQPLAQLISTPIQAESKTCREPQSKSHGNVRMATPQFAHRRQPQREKSKRRFFIDAIKEIALSLEDEAALALEEISARRRASFPTNHEVKQHKDSESHKLEGHISLRTVYKSDSGLYDLFDEDHFAIVDGLITLCSDEEKSSSYLTPKAA